MEITYTKDQRKKYSQLWGKWWLQMHNHSLDNNINELKFSRFACCVRDWNFPIGLNHYKLSILNGEEKYIVEIGKRLSKNL